MEFRIEATLPTAPADLKSVLEKARDAWLEKTPQSHAPDSPEGQELARSHAAIDRQRLANKDQDAGVSLREAVTAHAALVKRQAGSPNAEHKGALDLMNAGIAAAVAGAARSKVAVRCSIVGHFDLSLDGIRQRPAERLSVHVDSAG